MKLYLVRHGETNENKNHILQGHLDTRLNKKGISQAKKLAQRLKKFSFDIIYSSDLRRAGETAKIIEKSHNVKIKYDKRLRERDLGDFSGRKLNELPFDPFDGINKDKVIPHGESVDSQIKRMKEFIRELKDGDFLIVSHGGTMEVLIHLLLRKTLEEITAKGKQKNVGFHILEKKRNKWIQILENCEEHISK